MFSIERNLKTIDEFPIDREFKVQKLEDYHYEEDEKEARKKYRNMVVSGLGIPAIEYSD